MNEVICLRLVNLTPHPVVIWNDQGGILATIPPSGTVARVVEHRLGRSQDLQVEGEVGEFRLRVNDMVPERRVDNLLDPACEDVAYIVSRPVAAELPDRDDLYFPDELVRNEQGFIIGCRAFARLRRPSDDA